MKVNKWSELCRQMQIRRVVGVAFVNLKHNLQGFISSFWFPILSTAFICFCLIIKATFCTTVCGFCLWLNLFNIGKHLGPRAIVGYGVKFFLSGLFITSSDHLVVSINLLAFYHEWRALIGYATHYFFQIASSVACESSRPSSLPVRVAQKGRLFSQAKEAVVLFFRLTNCF